MTQLIACSPKMLPYECHDQAAFAAINENPLNRPNVHGLHELVDHVDQSSIAMMTSKYWRTNGVRLTVGFLDNPETDLRTRILQHMNAWAKTGNITFVETSTDPQVRISREGSGYWSYIGTDILTVDANEPTMNLQDFTMATEDSEFHRVVRHETGHTLGCPHEHMRADLVALIDPDKAIAYYGATQGWTPEQVRAQVLTPIEQTSIFGTPPDETSIMCYQIPGQLTKTGQPIIGGTDIDQCDYDFIGKVYPKPVPSMSAGGAQPSATPKVAQAGVSNAERNHNCSARIKLANGNRMDLHRELSMSQIEGLVHALRA